MKPPASMPRLKGYRFPREIVSFAVWAYHRFALSTGDVEDLLAPPGGSAGALNPIVQPLVAPVIHTLPTTSYVH